MNNVGHAVESPSRAEVRVARKSSKTRKVSAPGNGHGVADASQESNLNGLIKRFRTSKPEVVAQTNEFLKFAGLPLMTEGVEELEFIECVMSVRRVLSCESGTARPRTMADIPSSARVIDGEFSPE